MLLIGLAFADPVADTGVGCSSDQVYSTAPLTGATDVPLSLVPTVFFSDCVGSGADGIARVTVGEELVLEQRLETAEGDYAYVELDLVLEPDTEYALVYTPAEGGQEVQWSFATGSTVDHTPVERPPEHELPADWWWDRESDLSRFRLAADTAESVHAPTYVEARDDEGRVLSSYAKANGHNGTMYGQQEGRAEDLCLTLFQRDVDGSWAEGDTDCLEGQAPKQGCSTVPWAGLAPALLGLLGLRRRR